MKLPTFDFRFTLLTPCFSGTAEGKEATLSELRVPPIRGHIRFWHRAAFDANSANRIWGSTAGNEGQGSKVAIRITSDIPAGRQPFPLLPHKPSGQGSRAALPPASSATIQLQRLPGCANDDWAKAYTATQLWLLAGTLGYRASRAAGSVWPDAEWTPKSRDELALLLKPLIAHPVLPWGAALVAEGSGRSWTELREAASDTPRGPQHLFGNAQPRVPSPVRFKVVQLATGLCLLAVAPPNSALQDAETALRITKPDPCRWNDLGVWSFL